MTEHKETRSVMFIRRAVLPLALLSLALSVPAQTMVEARITTNSEGVTTSTGTLSAARSVESDAWGARREGRVDVSQGIVRAYASAVSVDPASNNGHFTWSRGTWQDDVVINSPGREGQAGRVRVAFTVDGSLATTNNGTSGVQSTAFASAEIKMNDDQGAIFSESNRPFSGTSSNVPGGFLNHQMTHTFNFTYGQSFRLWFQLRAEATERHETGVTVSSAIVDLEHTALWDGFDAVMDANGNAVTDFAVSSGSGVNWAQPVTPVPEPATIAALGLGGLALLRRRRKA